MPQGVVESGEAMTLSPRTFPRLTWLRWGAFAVCLTIGIAAMELASWLEDDACC